MKLAAQQPLRRATTDKRKDGRKEERKRDRGRKLFFPFPPLFLFFLRSPPHCEAFDGEQEDKIDV